MRVAVLLPQPFALPPEGRRWLIRHVGRTVNARVSGLVLAQHLLRREPTLQILVSMDTMRALDLRMLLHRETSRLRWSTALLRPVRRI